MFSSADAAQQHTTSHYRGRAAGLRTLAARVCLLLGLIGASACTGAPGPATSPPVRPAAAFLPEAPGELSGTLVNVQDGDSFRLRLSTGQIVRVRIGAIDAPELKQPNGDASRRALSGLLARSPIRIDAYKTDPYGRYVARVTTADRRDAGLVMVEAGMAWHFERYAREQAPGERRQYANAQRDARQARRGLWADAQPEAPWDYRRRTGVGNARR